VIGNVTLKGGVALNVGQSFSMLQTVSGNLRFEEVGAFGVFVWPALTSVGGELAAVHTLGSGSLNALPIGVVSVGALRLQDNTLLTTLTGTGIHVVGTGTITITGNTSLPRCRVNGFLAAQEAAGWTRTSTNVVVSGTIPCL
jgi:hypothetical protein